MQQRLRTLPAWVIRALTLGLFAITLPLAARGLYGPPGAWVHVRWQPSVDAAERQRLETAWQLVDGREDDSPATWRYDLIAPSAGRLRAIVEHAAVEDTHFIDRQPYALAPDAQRTARRGGLITVGGAVAVGIVDRLAMFLAVLAGLCVLFRHPMRVARWLMPYFEIARGVAADVWPSRSEFVAAFSATERPASEQPAACAPSYGQRATAAILFAGLLAIVAMASLAGASPASAAGALMIVYACGYLVGSLLVERLDEAPVLTWAVIRTVAGLLLSTIGFLLSLVLSLPWFLVPGALVAATVYFRGRRAFSWPHGVVRFQWDGVAAGILVVILVAPITITWFYMAPGGFPPVFYNADTPYFLEKVHALVATNSYPPESLSNVGGLMTYHFATHAMAALISRGSGLLPHHSLFLIVLPLLIVGVVAAAVAVARHVSPALPYSVAVPLMLISRSIDSNVGQNVGRDFLILSSVAAMVAAPSLGWRLPVFLIGSGILVKVSTAVALFAGFVLAEAWQAVRATRLRLSPQVLAVSGVFVAISVVFFVSAPVEPNFRVELFPLFHLRQIAEPEQLIRFVTGVLWWSLPVLVVSGTRIGDPDARSTPLLLWSIAPLLVVNTTHLLDLRGGRGGSVSDWIQILHPVPFLLYAFALSFANRRWELLGYRRRAAFLLTVALVIVPGVTAAARYSLLLLHNHESGNEFVDNRSLAEALAVVPAKDTLIVTNDLRYPAENFRRPDRQMQIPALFGHQAFAVNYRYEEYSFSSERRELQQLLEQPEWRDAILEAARTYHWTHLLIRKDSVHPAPIPLERLFENQFYAVFRFP